MNKDLFARFPSLDLRPAIGLDSAPRLVWLSATRRYRAVLSYQGERRLPYYGMPVFTVERSRIDALGSVAWAPIVEDEWVLHDLVGELLQTLAQVPDPDDE